MIDYKLIKILSGMDKIMLNAFYNRMSVSDPNDLGTQRILKYLEWGLDN